MGMWEGLYLGMQGIRERRDREMDREEARRIREEDMAFRREQFEAQRLDAYRTAILPVLLDRQEEARAEQRAINGLVTLGFSRPSANALYMTGEAPQLLEALKAQDYALFFGRAFLNLSRLKDRPPENPVHFFNFACFQNFWPASFFLAVLSIHYVASMFRSGPPKPLL